MLVRGTGVVAAFDEGRGLGTIRADVVAGLVGRWEASSIAPAA